MSRSKTTHYQGKNCLVLGGTFGIGEALCKQLATSGANLCISSRSEAKIALLLEELEGEHFGVTCDVTSEDLAKLHQEVFARWTSIDCLIFSAGAYEPMNIHNFHREKTEEILEVNLTGFIRFLSVFVESFREQKIAHLAVISSVAGYFGMPNSLGYGASKAGLSNLVESLHYELESFGTKVQLINPGFVKTRLTQKNTFFMPQIITPEKAAATILRQMQSGRFEIYFPFIFALTMRMLGRLPYRLRFFLLGLMN